MSTIAFILVAILAFAWGFWLGYEIGRAPVIDGPDW